MRSLAIIPARGGSKRIPRKNIKFFLGKPIISYSIQEAINSELFDEVMVSTDDQDIANIAKSYGANVPFFRSDANSNDFATTVDVLLEVISKYEDIGQQFDHICCMYPTAPFVSDDLLKRSLDHMLTNDLDSVCPVLPFSYPIQRALRMEDGKISMMHPENLNARSQDLEPAFHDCGQFYWIKTNVLKTKRKLWTDNTGGIVLEEMKAHDIDTLEDWKVAEFKYALSYETKDIL